MNTTTTAPERIELNGGFYLERSHAPGLWWLKSKKGKIFACLSESGKDEIFAAMTAPAAPSQSAVEEAINQLLNHQQQMDQDGIIVGVSRQAIDEAVAHIRSTARARESAAPDAGVVEALRNARQLILNVKYLMPPFWRDECNIRVAFIDRALTKPAQQAEPNELCPHCEGSGQDHGTNDACQHCEGDGRVNIHAQQAEPGLRETKTISGTVKLHMSKDGTKCVCCPEKPGHVFAMSLDLEPYASAYPDHFPRDVDNWLRCVFDFKELGGQTIRITAALATPSVKAGDSQAVKGGA